jgi:hypothetical protein
MSASGQNRTLERFDMISAIAPKADIPRRRPNVRLGPN